MRPRRPTSRAALRTPALLALVAIVAAGGSGGCNIVAPAAYFIGGLPKIDAEYQLQDVATVVFVDDRANVIGSNALSLRLAIGDKLTEELMVRKIISQESMISPRDAMSLVRSRDRHSELLPIDAIGRLVGAKQIIYVEMARFSLTQDGTPKPSAACAVRVIDVENRVRLFPGPDSQSAARPVAAELPAIDPALVNSPASRLAVLRGLAEETGIRIAKLFYRHESRDLGGRLQSP